MKAQIEYGLEGAFKVDLYSGKKLVETTDFFSNFITPTGLTYPTNYAFADCFRFLSLGDGSTANQGSQALGSLGTTGLSQPITGFQTSLSSIQTPLYINWRGYETGSNGGASACGTIIDTTGPRLFRSWAIPTGGEDVTVNATGVIGGLNIEEFMVSPSSGIDPTGKYAFSRVLRHIFIPNGYRAIVTYQLKINIQNTGVTAFNSGTFATGNAEVSNDLGLIREWANLSGYYRQVYHGLRCVDAAGATFIPKFGDGMEPCSRNLQSVAFYLSPDNAQFDAGGLGVAPNSVSEAYAADGLMSVTGVGTVDYEAYNEFSLDPDQLDNIYLNLNPDRNPSLPTEDSQKNIRLGNNSNVLRVPKTENYKNFLAEDAYNYQIRQSAGNFPISYATPGASGFNNTLANYGQKAVFSTKTTKLPIGYTGQNLITGRKKTLTRKSFFSPVSSLGYNTRFGSLVYAYRIDSSSIGDRNYYPLIDCLFYDSSGRSLMQHYRYITGFHLTERGTGVIDAKLFLEQTDTENIKKFTSYKTFQGPYGATFTHPRTSESYNGAYFDGATVCASGQVMFGGLNTSAYGVTYPTGIDSTITGENGWGAVYGIVVDENFCKDAPDLGLTNHSLQTLVEPANTGKLAWPLVLPLGAEIKLKVSGVTYYDSGYAAVVDTGFFFGTNQMVRDVDFGMVQSGNFGTDISPANLNRHVWNDDGNAGTYDSLTIGYYVTSKLFSGQTLAHTDFVNPTDGITGYFVKRSLWTNELRGLSWSGALPASNARLQFTPQVLRETIANAPLKTSSSTTGARKLTGLFASLSERGYVGGINNLPFTDTEQLNVFFTGQSGNFPLYVTLVRGYDKFSGPLTGYSVLSGNVKMTQFKCPTGYPLHTEGFTPTSGYRLLPNHGRANYYTSEKYSPVTGGAYPALSMDNGLEIYLDITWSSPCGTATNCNEPI